MKKLALYLGLLLVSSLASAQVVWVRTTMAGKPTCAAGIKGRVFEISDATTESDCSIGGATGNARKMSLCWCVWTAGTSAYEWQAIARGTAGATSPGGSDTQVQYNDGSAFGGDAGMTFNETTNVLTVTGSVVAPIVLPASQSLVGSDNFVRIRTEAGGGVGLNIGHTSNPYIADASGNGGSLTVKLGVAGTAADPTYTYTGDVNTGEYRVAEDVIGFTTGGVLRLRVVNGGIRLEPAASPPVTCGDANTLGYEYVDTSLARCFCDGTTWQVLNPSTAGVGTCS